MAFPSVYEMTNPLTTVRKQHFWDYFSGATLNSRWAVTNTGTNNSAMSDEVDGGYNLSTGTAVNNRVAISFGGIHPYSQTASTLIGVVKRGDVADQLFYLGMSESEDVASTSTDSVYCEDDEDGVDTKILLKTTRSGTTTEISSVTNNSTQWRTVKLENLTSSCVMTLDGISSVTSSSNTPTTPLQPIFQALTRESAQNTCSIKYIEAYNT